MRTPIYDFLSQYKEKNSVRLHMPGHKGSELLGCEPYDITEIRGADVLYSPEGIIAESEKNASELFGSLKTVYSTEGSTLCIKAMLAIATSGVKNPVVLAARNAHKAFIYACALLGIGIKWLYPSRFEHLCSCKLTPDEVDAAIDGKICAVYLTSPDYLGNVADVKGIAEVCHRHGIPLLVDNAHGAYLKFLSPSKHPTDLGCDMCCDSAHKTLPVLTGGAYLHVMNERYVDGANKALSLFASTSPSYLTLASLDLCNKYLAEGYAESLAKFVNSIEEFKGSLDKLGFKTVGDEPMKVTVDARVCGYTGKELGALLRDKNFEPEFCDSDYLVLLPTPEIGEKNLKDVLEVFGSIENKAPIKKESFSLCEAKAEMSVRDAIFAESSTVPINEALGKICASPTVSCPPAIPIAVSGEIIQEEHIKAFEYYGINFIDVVCK